MEENNLNHNNRGLVGMLIALIVILSIAVGYFIWKDTQIVDKKITEKNETVKNETEKSETEKSETEKNEIEQPKQTKMTAQWFNNYLTPIFKTNGRFDMVNATDEEIFSKGINLTVYLKGVNSSVFEKVGEKFLIKQLDVANNIEKYYGIKDFVYNVQDNQFHYDQARGGYLSTLEFGVGTSEGPVAQYTVSNVVYNNNDVTLTMGLNYNGELPNSEYSVNLKCINEQCVINSIIKK